MSSLQAAGIIYDDTARLFQLSGRNLDSAKSGTCDAVGPLVLHSFRLLAFFLSATRNADGCVEGVAVVVYLLSP